MELNLRHLEYFVALAETKSLGRATRRVGTQPSPLKRAIDALEENLGNIAVFEKDLTKKKRGKQEDADRKYDTLTPAGIALLGEARYLLAHAEEVQRKVSGVARGLSGSLRIAMTAAVFADQLGFFLRRRRKKAAQVALTAIHETVREQLRGLSEHSLDVGFVVTPANYAFDNADIEAITLESELVCMVMPDDEDAFYSSPDADERDFTLDKLSNRYLVVGEPDIFVSCLHEWVRQKSTREFTFDCVPSLEILGTLFLAERIPALMTLRQYHRFRSLFGSEMQEFHSPEHGFVTSLLKRRQDNSVILEEFVAAAQKEFDPMQLTED